MKSRNFAELYFKSLQVPAGAIRMSSQPGIKFRWAPAVPSLPTQYIGFPFKILRSRNLGIIKISEISIWEFEGI